MTTPDEFRKFAEECMQSARERAALACSSGIACLALVMLLLALIFSRNERQSLDGNTSSPPSIGSLRLR
jgi:hypothetical protein